MNDKIPPHVQARTEYARKVTRWLSSARFGPTEDRAAATIRQYPSLVSWVPRPVVQAAVRRARGKAGDPWLTALTACRLAGERLPDLADPSLRVLLGEPSASAVAECRRVVQDRTRPMRLQRLLSRARAEVTAEAEAEAEEKGIRRLQALGLLDAAGNPTVDDDGRPWRRRLRRGEYVMRPYRLADGSWTTRRYQVVAKGERS